MKGFDRKHVRTCLLISNLVRVYVCVCESVVNVTCSTISREELLGTVFTLRLKICNSFSNCLQDELIECVTVLVVCVRVCVCV